MAEMTGSRAAKVTLPTDEQILITREFDAPRHLVYKAWTTPELVMRWWSGQRGEMKLAEIDLRVGDREQALSLREVEALHIRRVLRRTGGHLAETAAILGVHRNTVASKVRRSTVPKNGRRGAAEAST
jgi:DNA-binding NtrC family response regulator